jgi:serine/threonine protein kinase
MQANLAAIARSNLQTLSLGADESVGFTLQPSMVPLPNPGERLGRYLLQHEIGRGGMGMVYQAFDESLNRSVALKLMAPHLAIDELARQRFVSEARAIAAVRSPYVVVIHAVEYHFQSPFLVMEYIHGKNAQQLLQEHGPLPLETLLPIAICTAKGLLTAHEKGLTHRDVKPSNILIEAATGHVKLTDFGLARAADDTRLTRDGLIIGTPAYMAPEQINNKQVDHRADLYSFGSVLYALASGHAPYEGSNTLALLCQLAQAKVRPLREIQPQRPAWFLRLVERLHQFSAEARPQTTAEVVRELESHLDANSSTEVIRVTCDHAVDESIRPLPAPPAVVSPATIPTPPPIAIPLASHHAKPAEISSSESWPKWMIFTIGGLSAFLLLLCVLLVAAIGLSGSKRDTATTIKPAKHKAATPTPVAEVPEQASQAVVPTAKESQQAMKIVVRSKTATATSPQETAVSSLKAAIELANHGDEIILHGPGKLESECLQIRDKELTIRAATHEPTEIVFADDHATRGDCLNSNTTLHLEGIHFTRLPPTEPYRGKKGSVFRMLSGDLHIQRCRFTQTGDGACLRVEATARMQIDISESEFNGGTGNCLVWNDRSATSSTNPQCKLSVRDSTLTGRTLLLFTVPPDPQLKLNLSKNVWLGRESIRVQWTQKPTVALDRRSTARDFTIVTEGNQFQTECLIVFWPLAEIEPFIRQQKTKRLLEVFRWNGRQNTFLPNMRYSHAFSAELEFVPLQPQFITTLHDWKQLWLGNEIDSREAKTNFAGGTALFDKILHAPHALRSDEFHILPQP